MIKSTPRTLLGATLLAIISILPAAQMFAQTSVISDGQTTQTTTTSMGTVSAFTPQMITIKTETSAAPVQYTYSKTTTYVDETGAPVSMETVKSGLPVTVYYVKQGDVMVASKVVVKKTTTMTTAPVTPVVEEKSSSTTTTTTSDK